MMEVRKAAGSDAAQIIEVMKSAEESGFMLFEPGERDASQAPFSKFIEATNEKENSGFFIASEGSEILGYLMVLGESTQRISHRAYLVIGVHKNSRGKGIGKALLSYAVDWAESTKLHRLELTVITDNIAAFSLYKQMGFVIEGVKKDSLFIDNRYTDEYYMARIL